MTTIKFSTKKQRDEWYDKLHKDNPYMTLITTEDKGKYLLAFHPPAPRPLPKLKF